MLQLPTTPVESFKHEQKLKSRRIPKKNRGTTRIFSQKGQKNELFFFNLTHTITWYVYQMKANTPPRRLEPILWKSLESFLRKIIRKLTKPCFSRFVFRKWGSSRPYEPQIELCSYHVDYKKTLSGRSLLKFYGLKSFFSSSGVISIPKKIEYP